MRLLSVLLHCLLLILAAAQTAPILVSTQPASGSVDFLLGDRIQFTFDQMIQCGARCSVSIMYEDTVVNEIVVDETMIQGMVLTIIPQLESDKTYTIVIPEGALLNQEGLPFQGLDNYTIRTADVSEPVLTETVPEANGEINNVSVIQLKFNKNIFVAGNWTASITCSGETLPIPSDVPEVVSNVISIAVEFPSYVFCVLNIEEFSIMDSFGNELSEPITLPFNTKDMDRPVLSMKLSPVDDITKAAVNTNIEIHIADQTEVTFTSSGVISIVTSTRIYEYSAAQLSIVDNTIVIMNEAAFVPSDVITVHIPEGFIRDAAGNVNVVFDFSFTVTSVSTVPSLKCNLDTFKTYLEKYPYKYAGSSLDEYITTHTSMFMHFCHKFNYKGQINAKPELTVFMDWSDDDMAKLGELSVRYSGVASLNEAVRIMKNQVVEKRKARSFIQDSLVQYCSKETICSTSWATSVVEVAEAALQNTVQLSVDQLIQCLPKEEGIDGCQGVHPKTLTTYLIETGLVSKDDFTDCDSLDEKKRYRFNAVYPESPNGGGLMNLVAEGKPVFTMVALDLAKLRFVKDMTHIDEPHRCGGYEPSLYGVVSGYKYDEVMIEDSWWEIVSHVVPCEEMVVRIPMSGNMTTANYGGIAAYAFTLNRVDEE